MKQRIYVDGSGDGRHCWINETTNAKKVYRKSGITNNEAEYLAVYNAILENKSGDMEILSDSKLAVNQLNGNWHIKEDRLRNLFDKIQEIIKQKNIKVAFIWVPREENKAGKCLG